MRVLATGFLVLAEIAARQPSVRQAEIAEKLGISAQAVSECVKSLIKTKLVESSGKGSYMLTPKGYEYLFTGAREIKDVASFLLEEVVSGLKVYTAVAAEDLEPEEKVFLWMEQGMLYAGKRSGKASGKTLDAAKRGEDVAVVEVRELVAPPPGMVTVVKVPRVEKGGSRATDIEMLQRLAEDSGFVAALGVEAKVALEKAGIACDAFFGAPHASVEAALHGMRVLTVAVEDELSLLLRKLERAGLNYRLVDANTRRQLNEG